LQVRWSAVNHTRELSHIILLVSSVVEVAQVNLEVVGEAGVGVVLRDVLVVRILACKQSIVPRWDSAPIGLLLAVGTTRGETDVVKHYLLVFVFIVIPLRAELSMSKPRWHSLAAGTCCPTPKIEGSCGMVVRVFVRWIGW